MLPDNDLRLSVHGRDASEAEPTASEFVGPMQPLDLEALDLDVLSIIVNDHLHVRDVLVLSQVSRRCRIAAHLCRHLIETIPSKACLMRLAGGAWPYVRARWYSLDPGMGMHELLSECLIPTKTGVAIAWKNLDSLLDLEETKRLVGLKIRGHHPLQPRQMTLPARLGELVDLERLEITCEELNLLPMELANLYQLKTLCLSNCFGLRTVPQFVFQLRKLKVLDLSWCIGFKTLPSELGNMGGLEELVLSNCRNLTALPESIQSLKSLRLLDLTDCSSLELSDNQLDWLGSLSLRGAIVKWQGVNGFISL